MPAASSKPGRRTRDPRPAPPLHRGLLASTVQGAAARQRLEAIPGAPPDMTLLPSGCSFAPRCRFADARCGLDLPPEIALASDHMARCLRVAAGEIEVAPPKLDKLRLGDAA